MDIKRKKSEVIWITVWLTLSITWISFLLYLLVITQPEFNKDTMAIGVFCNIPTIIFLFGLLTMLKSKVRISTVEFLIHKYDRWNYNNSDYDTLYFTERVDTFANFIYFKNTGISDNKMSQDELEYYCKNRIGYDNFIGYQTEQEAMNEILDTIKRIIAQEKSVVNVKVKNVSTVQTLTIEELREIVEPKKQ